MIPDDYARKPSDCDRPNPVQLPQLNGIFVLDKPSGPSSAQCLAKIKRLGQRKIGHCGTLDPMASGVLLVLLGQATKLSSYLMSGGGKIYNGLLRLGVETDTWDAEGRVARESAWQHIGEDQARLEVESWTLLREQPVPPYSAAKHQGQALYKLARSGRETPLKTKSVAISSSEILHMNLPFVRFRVACGTGVYIRSLAHSLGKRLGCGAALFELTRERSHPFGLEDACPLADVLARPELLAERLKSFWDALPDWPRIQLTEAQAASVRNGVAVKADANASRPLAFLCHGGEALAVARLERGAGGKAWAVARGLWN